jgi:hypothetical protein
VNAIVLMGAYLEHSTVDSNMRMVARRNTRMRLVVFLVAALVAGSGCRAFEWIGGMTHARLDDAAVKPYLDSAAQSSRAEFGFTALPQHGDVRIEIPRMKTYYDVMLHIHRGNVSRTVHFLRRDSQLIWSGEQEIHSSGRFFKTVDGDVNESLTISYSTVVGSGTPKGGYVLYWGPDQALQERSDRNQISVADAKRIWEKWQN